MLRWMHWNTLRVTIQNEDIDIRMKVGVADIEDKGAPTTLVWARVLLCFGRKVESWKIIEELVVNQR